MFADGVGVAALEAETGRRAEGEGVRDGVGVVVRVREMVDRRAAAVLALEMPDAAMTGTEGWEHATARWRFSETRARLSGTQRRMYSGARERKRGIARARAARKAKRVKRRRRRVNRFGRSGVEVGRRE
jgi:hypothetical protein